MTEQNRGQVARQEPEKPLVKMDPSKKITDLDEASRLCDTLARSTIVPKSLQGKASNIFVVIMAGQEMGLPWPVALRTIYSPGEGQIGIRGQLLLAKLREAGHGYTWEEATDACTFRLRRNAYRADQPDEDYSATFTVEDAIQAGLAKRHENGTIIAVSQYGNALPWQQYSSDMLFWRAVAKCVRRAAPEVMLGFEVQGAEPATEPEPEVQLKPGDPTGAGQPGDPGGPEASTPDAALRDLDQRMRGTGAGGSTFAQDMVVHGGPPARVHSGQGGGGASSEHPPATVATGGPGVRIDVDESWARETERGESDAMRLAAELERADAALASDDDIPDEPDPADEPGAAPSGAGRDDGGLDEDPAMTPGRAAAQAKSQILAEQFTALGWTPRKFRADVLRACSMYLRRRVGGVREMTADEMMRLAEELGRLQRKHMDERDVYPVAMADKTEEWREAWEQADIAGYEKYAEGEAHGH